jgi:hypothetical protein
MYKIAKRRGYLVLADIPIELINKYLENYKIPLYYIKNIEKRDGENKFHLSITNPNENINELIFNDILVPFNENNIIGIGCNEHKSTYWLICVNKELDNLRLKWNMVSKYFHITLGFNDYGDIHNINKDLNTLIDSNNESIIKIIKNLSLNTKKNINLLKQLNYYKCNHFKILKNFCSELSKNGNMLEALDYSYQLISLNESYNNLIAHYIFLKLLDYFNKIDYYEYRKILLQVDIYKSNHMSNEIIEIVNKEIIRYSLLQFDLIKLKFEEIELPTNFSQVPNISNLFGSGIISSRHIPVLKSLI